MIEQERDATEEQEITPWGIATALAGCVVLGAPILAHAAATGAITAAKGEGFDAGWDSTYEAWGERVFTPAVEFADAHNKELNSAGLWIIQTVASVWIGKRFGGAKRG